MPPQSLVKKSDSIPLSVAVTLVSYSRDYIGRLAREGKIVAEQIDREWFVSRQSLLNFAEHTSLEDSAKKKILSLSRKNDLEVKDFYAKKVSSIQARQLAIASGSLAATFVVMLGGVLSGYFFYANAPVLVTDSKVTIADTLISLRINGGSQSANLVGGVNDSNPVWSEGLVVESNETMAIEEGIVLFPTVRSGDVAAVEDLFSDEVTVVVTSTTTGFIRSADGASELPFVRVPQETTF